MAAKGKLSKNQVAAIIGIVAGIMMLMAGVTGAAAWGSIVKFLENKVGTGGAINILAYILITVASLGGLIVILGSLLFTTKHVRAGRLLIALGAGFGLIGLILFILVNLEKVETAFLGGIGLGALGLILSVVARLKSEVPEKTK